MAILHIEHAVRDFDSWKRAFDGDPVGRSQGGVRAYRVMRAADDPNFVVVELEFATLAEADGFRTKLEQLWGRVSGDLGLARQQARVFETVDEQEPH